MIKSLKTKVVALFAIAASSVFATAIAATDDFYEFYQKLDSWSNSGLAVGLALTALIIGGGIGAAKASPMPAIGGVGVAAFFAFGPGVILQLITGGSVLF